MLIVAIQKGCRCYPLYNMRMRRGSFLILRCIISICKCQDPSLNYYQFVWTTENILSSEFQVPFRLVTLESQKKELS